MSISSNLARRFNINQIRSSFTKRKKVIFGCGILLGVATPTLLSSEFSKYSLETHDGYANAKELFREKYGKILRKHQSEPLLYSMIALNLIIYGFWKIRPDFMQKHFLCNLHNIKSKRYHTLLTANWSHMDFWHVGLNMYVLYNFGSLLITIIGIPSFLSIYFLSGCLGSAGSLLWHSLSRVPYYSSLGASSSLLGIITSFALYEPDARFKIILSPDTFSFSAYNGILGLIIFDSLGLLFRWRFLDHAAHLSGALTGFVSWNYICKKYGKSSNDNNLLCINGEYIFKGNYSNYKINDDHGTIYSSTKTYFGEMLENKFIFNGKGCLRNELNGSVFYGYFNNGYIQNIGLLCLNNGKIYPAQYDKNDKDFKIPQNFNPDELNYLLNQDIAIKPLIEHNENYKENDKDVVSVNDIDIVT